MEVPFAMSMSFRETTTVTLIIILQDSDCMIRNGSSDCIQSPTTIVTKSPGKHNSAVIV